LKEFVMRASLLGTGHLLLSCVVAQSQTQAPNDAELYFISPRDGQRLRGAFTVRFGLSNMGVTQAGSSWANSGHHHLLVDVAEPLHPNEPIPSGNNYQHFGGGQTETRLQLPPGRHTLQLVLGDAEHRPFEPMVISRKITIHVLPPLERRPGPRR
jgi:hypothetical protein